MGNEEKEYCLKTGITFLKNPFQSSAKGFPLNGKQMS